eukprot:5207811-Alexandrium_andersonii.AAC.1
MRRRTLSDPLASSTRAASVTRSMPLIFFSSSSGTLIWPSLSMHPLRLPRESAMEVTESQIFALIAWATVVADR